MQSLDKSFAAGLLKPRKPDSHKGTHGHLLLIAGNTGRMGAALIAARCGLRTGPGLLTVNVPSSERMILQAGIPEAMLIMRDSGQHHYDPYTAACIGPAIGTGKESDQLLRYMLRHFNKPLLLDADALNIIAANNELVSEIPAGTVLTPHPLEFDRLFGKHENAEDRIQTAVNKAKDYHLVIVLKSSETLITSSGETFINTNGNPGLAKGGSGDGLSGIIGALLAQGYNPFDAARLGVYLHGAAADLTLETQSFESMLISDVCEHLGKAFKQLYTA